MIFEDWSELGKEMAKCNFKYFEHGIGEKEEECIHEAWDDKGLCKFHSERDFGNAMGLLQTFEREGVYDLRGFRLYGPQTRNGGILDKPLDLSGARLTSNVLFSSVQFTVPVKITGGQIEGVLKIDSCTGPELTLHNTHADTLAVLGPAVNHLKIMGGHYSTGITLNDTNPGQATIVGPKTPSIGFTRSTWSGPVVLKDLGLKALSLIEAQFQTLTLTNVNLTEQVSWSYMPAGGDITIEGGTCSVSKIQGLQTKGKLTLKGVHFTEGISFEDVQAWLGAHIEEVVFDDRADFMDCHFIPPQDKSRVSLLFLKNIKVNEYLKFYKVKWGKLLYQHANPNQLGEKRQICFEGGGGSSAEFEGGKLGALAIQSTAIHNLTIHKGFQAEQLHLSCDGLRSLALVDCNFGDAAIQSLPFAAKTKIRHCTFKQLLALRLDSKPDATKDSKGHPGKLLLRDVTIEGEIQLHGDGQSACLADVKASGPITFGGEWSDLHLTQIDSGATWTFETAPQWQVYLSNCILGALHLPELSSNNLNSFFEFSACKLMGPIHLPRRVEFEWKLEQGTLVQHRQSWANKTFSKPILIDESEFREALVWEGSNFEGTVTFQKTRLKSLIALASQFAYLVIENTRIASLTHFQGTHFKYISITHSFFKDLNLEQAKLSRTQFYEICTFGQLNIKGLSMELPVTFTACWIRGLDYTPQGSEELITFNQLNRKEPDQEVVISFRGTELPLIEPPEVTPKELQFADQDCSRLGFVNSSLSHANFLGADVRETRFDSCQWALPEGAPYRQLFGHQAVVRRFTELKSGTLDHEARKEPVERTISLAGIPVDSRSMRSLAPHDSEKKLPGNIRIAPPRSETDPAIIKQNLHLLQSLYLQLNKRYEEERDFAQAGAFHYWELELRLLRQKHMTVQEAGGLRKWLVLKIENCLLETYRCIGDHGENYVRLFFVTLSWPLFSALVVALLESGPVRTANQAVRSFLLGDGTGFWAKLILGIKTTFQAVVPRALQNEAFGTLTWFTRGWLLVSTTVTLTLVTLFVLSLRRRFRR